MDGAFQWQSTEGPISFGRLRQVVPIAKFRGGRVWRQFSGFRRERNQPRPSDEERRDGNHQQRRSWWRFPFRTVDFVDSDKQFHRFPQGISVENNKQFHRFQQVISWWRLAVAIDHYHRRDSVVADNHRSDCVVAVFQQDDSIQCPWIMYWRFNSNLVQARPRTWILIREIYVMTEVKTGGGEFWGF